MFHKTRGAFYATWPDSRFVVQCSLAVLLLGLMSDNICSLSPQLIADDVVVVRSSQWASAIDSWKEYRTSQGYSVFEVDAELGREGVRKAIIEIAANSHGRLKFVLLAGDVADTSDPTSIGTFYHPSSALVQFGGDKVLASDNDYADLDGDHSPDLAVGRMPADSPSQLTRALERSIQYERSLDFGVWRRNVHVVAGVGGFGAVTDSVIEMTTRRFLSERIPGWSNLSMTQASLQSHYCPDPLRFSDACLQRLNEGGMFWVYIGHGHVKTLDYLQVDNQWLPIFNESHVPQLQSPDKPPIAVFLACYTGAFDAREKSLAEQMVMSPTGPIAAIAASRVSGPYGLAMLSDGMLTSCFDDQLDTVGEIVQRAKQRLLSPQLDDVASPSAQAQLKLINALADALSPKDYDLAAERLEHVWQVNLLGDPLLKLSHPTKIKLTLPEAVQSGQPLRVTGSTSQAGKLRIELANCRGRVSKQLQSLQVDHATATGRESYQDRYEAANQPVLVSDETSCQPGDFERILQVPEGVESGKYCIRVLQQCEEGWQVGYAELRIRSPRK